MSKMNLGNTGAILISAFIYGNTYTYKLDISHNKISDDGAIAISEYLKDNSTLQELNMLYNEVSNNGITYIGKALQINPMLQILDVSYNKISDDGVIAFSDYLKKRNKLRELRISWNDDIFLEFCNSFFPLIVKMFLGDCKIRCSMESVHPCIFVLANVTTTFSSKFNV